MDYEATRREISTEQGVLRYHEAGDGPPLLLLHGSGPGVTALVTSMSLSLSSMRVRRG